MKIRRMGDEWFLVDGQAETDRQTWWS